MSVVDEARHSFFVYCHLSGHATKFEEVHFLSVKFQDSMRWVRQTDKGQIILLPVVQEGCCIVGTDHYNFGILCCEFVIILAQLRHVLLAEGSEKSAVENEENILFVLKIGQVDFASCEIGQREIWSGLVEFGAAHNGMTKMMPKIISTTRLMTFDWTTDLSTTIETARTSPMPR